MHDTFEKGIVYSGNRCRTAIIYPSKLKELKEEIYKLDFNPCSEKIDDDLKECLLFSLFLNSLNRLQIGGRKERIKLYRLLTLGQSRIYSRLCENISDFRIYNEVFTPELGALTVMVTSIKRSYTINNILNYYMKVLKDERVIVEEQNDEVQEIEHRIVKSEDKSLDDFLYECAPNYKKVILFTDKINKYVSQVG